VNPLVLIAGTMALTWAAASMLPESRKHWSLYLPLLAGAGVYALCAYALNLIMWAFGPATGLLATTVTVLLTGYILKLGAEFFS
jgi:hypothetical protein